MSGKITGYTPKSTNFVDTDLFDVSKSFPQTSGILVIGREYTILDYNAGDNFLNVGASANVTGEVFVATGTTPTTYSNGSTLVYYDTKSYTWAELKAEKDGFKKYVPEFTQSGTSDPVVTVRENTLGGTVVWTRTALGKYKGTLAGAFVVGKVFIPGFSTNFNSTGNASVFLPLSTNGNPQTGWINIYLDDVNGDWMELDVYDMTGLVEWSSIMGGGNFCLPEIRVYP